MVVLLLDDRFWLFAGTDNRLREDHVKKYLRQLRDPMQRPAQLLPKLVEATRSQ
jgi:hypothetical protein